MSSDWVLFGAVFVASLVEAVEALTIVLASGVTRGWRSTLEGLVSALLALTVLVVGFGPALVHFVPLNMLRLVVGTLLLIFGLQWLRKSILRATGYTALRDEDAIYRDEVALLSSPSEPTSGRDATAFTVSFKGVFLEGLEVVVIVITLGTPSGRLGLAILAASIAVLVVAVAGIVVHHRLAGVPENAMKMVVGVVLTSFGTFWLSEGAGLSWPGSDLAVIALAVFFAMVTLMAVIALRQGRAVPDLPEAA